MNSSEALGGDFFVGEAIVAEIAVAIAVIPLIALRTSAAGADFNDDETELRKRDVRALGRKSFVDFLGLRAGIDELDEGIFSGGIEVERLVHNTVEIGDAVFGFDFEGFGEFVAGFKKLRDVGGFEVEKVAALRIDENGLGSGVDAGIGVFKIFAGVWGTEGVRKIPGS